MEVTTVSPLVGSIFFQSLNCPSLILLLWLVLHKYFLLRCSNWILRFKNLYSHEMTTATLWRTKTYLFMIFELKRTLNQTDFFNKIRQKSLADKKSLILSSHMRAVMKLRSLQLKILPKLNKTFLYNYQWVNLCFVTSKCFKSDLCTINNFHFCFCLDITAILCTISRLK